MATSLHYHNKQPSRLRNYRLGRRREKIKKEKEKNNWQTYSNRVDCRYTNLTKLDVYILHWSGDETVIAQFPSRATMPMLEQKIKIAPAFSSYKGNNIFWNSDVHCKENFSRKKKPKNKSTTEKDLLNNFCFDATLIR